MRHALPVFLCCLACRDTNGPLVTADPPLSPDLAQLAVVTDVPLVPRAPTPATLASVVGRDVIDVEVDDVRRSLVGQFLPGRVRVTARLRVVNRLARTTLVPPTFPTPPTADNQVFLFVVRAAAVDEPGGVTSASNTVSISVPGSGAVSPSTDWDGEPWDFLRGGSCRPPAATCARHEAFEAPLAAGGRSEWRTVGFDIDPRVRHLRLHLVLAADLANAP